MSNILTLLWQRLSANDSHVKAEVDRIAFLQQTAVTRRAEYGAEQRKAAAIDTAPVPNAVSASRKRMEEAEAAHRNALQRWENKQSGQKSH